MILFDFEIFHDFFTSNETYGILSLKLLFYLKLKSGEYLEKIINYYGFSSTFSKLWLLKEG